MNGYGGRVMYLPAIVVAAAGVVFLLAMLLRLVMVLRRFTDARTLVAGHLGERAGLVRARVAALRVAFGSRRHADPDSS